MKPLREINDTLNIYRYMYYQHGVLPSYLYAFTG